MIAFLDCFAGVSGDKFLGAAIDAGADVEAVSGELEGLSIGEWAIEADRVSERGIASTRVRVRSGKPLLDGRWSEVRAEIERAPLRESVRAKALAVFAALAGAEAGVHGIAEDDVHFHEVGAIDSIIDVVGTVAALELLGVETLRCSAVPTGWGTVRCEHGVLPVPAPATAGLLLGIPTVPGEAEGELTTPTGAALVSVIADGFGPPPAMTPSAVGYGAGSRRLEIPNVARLTLGDPLAPPCNERTVVLETVVDHLPAETLAIALDTLCAGGALEAWQTPVAMKKARLGTNVTVLAPLALADALAEDLLRLTGSLGLRRYEVSRRIAAREERVLRTSLGAVRFKVGGEGWMRIRPESDDVARLARETGIAPDVLSKRLAEEAERLLG